MDVALYFTQLWEMWEKSRRAVMVRYEDLLADPFEQMERISAHIGIIVSAQNIRAIIERYQISNRANWKHDLHFNVGKAGRWKERMSPEQQQKAMELFGEYLPRMGYES
jgi:hypothetical protein